MTSDVPFHLLMSIQRGTMAYRYKSVPMLKSPFDLAIYPLLLERARPRTLIEIGSHCGGSAIWFADIAAGLGLSLQVISVDIAPVNDARHAGVTFLQGDARDLGPVFPEGFFTALPRPLLVIDDSDHQFKTCLAILRFFDRWMEPGEFIAIEDGILSDMQLVEEYGGGPLRAIETFLGESDSRYVVDRDFCDYFGHNVTWNVDGYLRRV